jgi:hypothetical protein
VSAHAGALDLGRPISFLTLREGTAVYDRSGERIGVVERVLGDQTLDIFDGLIVHTLPLPGRHLLADADQIAELRERGVLLAVERDALRAPRDLSDEERSSEEEPADGWLRAFLRRAWDRIGGAG